MLLRPASEETVFRPDGTPFGTMGTVHMRYDTSEASQKSPGTQSEKKIYSSHPTAIPQVVVFRFEILYTVIHLLVVDVSCVLFWDHAR